KCKHTETEDTDGDSRAQHELGLGRKVPEDRAAFIKKVSHRRCLDSVWEGRSPHIEGERSGINTRLQAHEQGHSRDAGGKRSARVGGTHQPGQESRAEACGHNSLHRTVDADEVDSGAWLVHA